MSVPAAPPQPDAGATPPATTGAEAAPAPAAEATPVAASEPTPPATTGAEATTAEAQPTPEPRPSRRERERAARGEVEATPAAPAPATTSPSPDEIIAAYERQRADREAREKSERERRESVARYVGDVPADAKLADGPTLYERLREQATAEIPIIDTLSATQDEYDAREQAIRTRNEAQRRLTELTERREMVERLAEPARIVARQEANVWFANQIEAGIANLGLDVAKIVAVGQQSPGQLTPLVEAIGREMASRAEAPLKARIAELEADNETLESDVAEFRRQAGGALPNPARGGQVTGPGHVYTRAELAEMSRTSEGMARYQQNRQEIERQAAAGLIR